MDGARASGLYRTVVVTRARRAKEATTSRQVAAARIEVWGVSPDGAAAGADLGGSSKYSNENFED